MATLSPGVGTALAPKSPEERTFLRLATRRFGIWGLGSRTWDLYLIALRLKSRDDSRFLIASRLSNCRLPRARPISSFANPSLK